VPSGRKLPTVTPPARRKRRQPSAAPLRLCAQACSPQGVASGRSVALWPSFASERPQVVRPFGPKVGSLSLAAMSSPLPSAIVAALSSAPVVGFSGSRSLAPPALSVCLSVLASSSSPSSSVFVGCAPGVDAAVRLAVPSPQLRVFSVAAFAGPRGVSRGSFAARSVAFVRALAGVGAPLFSFPSGPCPVGVAPSSSSSSCFCGAGSGSWASLAFAVGSGVPCFVALPSGVAVPDGWGFSPLGAFGGAAWFSFAPPVSLSLF